MFLQRIMQGSFLLTVTEEENMRETGFVFFLKKTKLLFKIYFHTTNPVGNDFTVSIIVLSAMSLEYNLYIHGL